LVALIKMNMNLEFTTLCRVAPCMSTQMLTDCGPAAKGVQDVKIDEAIGVASA
jgi:hypothetical protein